MIPASSHIEIGSDTREALKTFLESSVGDNFLEALNAFCPQILKIGSAEDQIAAANRHAGFEECLERILFLKEPLPPEPESEKPGSYPSLEDDKAWPKEETLVDIPSLEPQ